MLTWELGSSGQMKGMRKIPILMTNHMFEVGRQMVKAAENERVIVNNPFLKNPVTELQIQEIV